MHNKIMIHFSGMILWLSALEKHDETIVGKKAVLLAELYNANIPIPDGFVITTTAYLHFLHHNKLNKKIQHLLSTINYEQPDSVLQVARHIHNLIISAELPEQFVHELAHAYHQLKSKTITVSSSKSLENYSAIKGDANLMIKVKEAWAAFFSPHNLVTHQKKVLTPTDHALLIQEEILSNQTGKLFTTDPLTHASRIVVEGDNLTDQQLEQLTTLGEKLKKHFYLPQEITWAFTKDKLYIVDIKPLSLTLQQTNDSDFVSTQTPFLTGTPASFGIVTGQVKIVTSEKDLGKVLPGDIMVVVETSPVYLVAIKKASALVAEKPGSTSHAALIARELGKPAVVGVKGATKQLYNGHVVTIHGKKGAIYHSTNTIKSRSTITHLYAHLTRAFSVEDLSAENIDGVGLINQTALGSQEPLKKIVTLCNTLKPHPVLYQTVDVLDDDFTDELKLIQLARTKEHATNLWVLLPLLRTVKELSIVKHTLSTYGLHRSPSFKLWLTVAAPSTAILLEDFIQAGIDGISVDIDELSHHLLARKADPTDPAVLRIVAQVIQTANQHNLPSSLYGTALTKHSSLIERAINWGVTSITVPPSALDATRQQIMAAEQKRVTSL